MQDPEQEYDVRKELSKLEEVLEILTFAISEASRSGETDFETQRRYEKEVQQFGPSLGNALEGILVNSNNYTQVEVDDKIVHVYNPPEDKEELSYLFPAPSYRLPGKHFLVVEKTNKEVRKKYSLVTLERDNFNGLFALTDDFEGITAAASTAAEINKDLREPGKYPMSMKEYLSMGGAVFGGALACIYAIPAIRRYLLLGTIIGGLYFFIKGLKVQRTWQTYEQYPDFSALHGYKAIQKLAWDVLEHKEEEIYSNE
jgi:hypothetical protein